MRHVLDLVGHAQRSDATVLVTGEAGTGKERVAREIHDRSARASGPFVPVRCGSLAPSSLEALGASADPASQTVDVTASSEDPVLTVPVLRLRRRVDASAAPGGTKQPDP